MTTDTAIAITHQLQTPLVLVDQEAVAYIKSLRAKADAISTTDADSLQANDKLAKEMKRLSSGVKSDGKTLRSPITKLGKDIIALEKEVTGPLDASFQRLARTITDHTDEVEQERQRVIAENKRREEEAMRQHQEQQRRLEERRKEREQAEENERKRKVAQLEAEHRAERDGQPDLFDRAAQNRPGIPTGSLDEPTVVGPGVQPIMPAIEPVVEVELEPVPPKPTVSVHTRQIDELEIYDESLIPDEIAGRRLRVIDEKAVEELLKAKIDVPGARFKKKTIVVGRR